MLPQTIDKSTQWTVVTWAAPLLLAAAALFFVPPGMLPFRPESLYSDAALNHWPNAYYLRHAVWQHHQWPLWDPLTMLGQPFAANPLTKVWYPPQWLVLILPPTLHLNVLIVLHIALLARGAIGWAREMRLGIASACLLALGLGLNLKLLAHLGAGHLDILYAIAWVPWVLWAGCRFAVKPSLRRGMWMGVAAALTVLADVRIAFYMLPLAALYAIWLLLTEQNNTAVVLFLFVAGAVALLLTTVQTIPIVALAPYLTRSAISSSDAAALSLPIDQLIGIVVPNVGSGHEWVTYLGIPLLVLACIAVIRSPRRDRWLWLAACLLTALWALGENGPLFGPIVRLAPLVGWFRVPSRAWFVTGLSVTVLAAYGLDVLDGEHGTVIARLAAAGMAGAGLTVLIAWLVVQQVGQLGGLPAAGGALLLGGTGLWLIQLDDLNFGSLDRFTLSRGLIVVALAVPNVAAGTLLVEGRSVRDLIANDSSLIDALAGRCDRVLATSFDLIGIASMRHSIPMLQAVDPFQLQSSAEIIASAAGTSLQGYDILIPPASPDNELDGTLFNIDSLAALGVGVIVSREPLSDVRLSAIDSPDGWYLYEVAGGPPLFIAPEDVDAPLQPSDRIVHAECDPPPNRLLDVKFESLPFDELVVLVLPQAWLPGWKARIDGQPAPVIRVGGALLGVEMDPTGPHHVEVFYRPTADLIGVGISGLTTLVLIAYAIASRPRREKMDG